MKKHDEPGLNGLMMQTRVLRRRCVEAHNRLHNDSGHSVLAEVIRCLPVSVSFDNHCAEHRLLSCYAFWGHSEIGGGRNGFDRRLERSSPVPIQLLHRRMKAASFRAWECADEPISAQKQAKWSALGVGETASDKVERHQVALLTNVDGEPAFPVPGEIRVGWMIEEEGRKALLFSMSLEYEATMRLRRTAEETGWHAPDAGEEGGFRPAEYERDLLTQAVRPSHETCGLDDYYYLPLNQRTSFPSRFVRSLIDHISGRYHRKGPPWHVVMAKASTVAALDSLRVSFEAARQRAGRSAGRYRGDQIDPSYLPRIAPDEEILAAFGVEPDGAIDLSDFLPIKMHLLEYLDFDESWFEAAGLSLKTPIHQARAHLDDASKEERLRSQLEEAIERHRVRLRWVTLVRRALEDELHGDTDSLLVSATFDLDPDYEELYEAAKEIFGATILDRRLGEVLARERGLASRIESALLEKGAGERPLRVSDLPETEFLLGLVRGIGPKSVEALTHCLREAMLSWPSEFTRPSGDSDGEAAEGIESGLDELDALFG
jgi:hypothetical protein